MDDIGRIDVIDSHFRCHNNNVVLGDAVSRWTQSVPKIDNKQKRAFES